MSESTPIVAGVDTHTDTIHVAAITTTGTEIGDREFATTRAGYTAALRFLHEMGAVERIGVEGTASYGAGFTRAAIADELEVLEVSRAVKPHAGSRANLIHSTPTALRAPRWPATGRPPQKTTTAGLRALHIARRSAIKHRTAVINQIKALLISAPDAIREKYRGSTTLKMIEALVRSRPQVLTDPPAQAVLTAAKMLAQRVQFLEAQPKPSTPRSTRWSPRPIPDYGRLTVSARTPPRNCSSPPD